MAKQIVWTPEAESTFEGVIDYLERKWTDKEIVNFIEATDRVVKFLAEPPGCLEEQTKGMSTRPW